MSYYSLSNLDIKMHYIDHELDEKGGWKRDLFENVKFFASFRAKKYISHHMFEDIEQEAFFGLWTAIETFDYNKNFDFYRWAQWNISKKIRRILIEDKKDKKSKVSFKKNFDPVTNQNYEDKILLNKIFLIIFNSFSKRERQIFINNMIDGMTLSEIGLSFGISAERVRQIKNNILHRIRKIA